MKSSPPSDTFYGLKTEEAMIGYKTLAVPGPTNMPFEIRINGLSILLGLRKHFPKAVGIFENSPIVKGTGPQEGNSRIQDIAIRLRQHACGC